LSLFILPYLLLPPDYQVGRGGRKGPEGGATLRRAAAGPDATEMPIVGPLREQPACRIAPAHCLAVFVVKKLRKFYNVRVPLPDTGSVAQGLGLPTQRG